MRNMSFFLTTQQFLDCQKTITRRLGWLFLESGEHFMGVQKAQGLKKGEKINRLGECFCISNTPEPLDEIIRRPIRKVTDIFYWQYLSKTCNYFSDTKGCTNPANLGYHCGFYECPGFSETAREGFPDMTPEEFVEMFCREMKCRPDSYINRIELERVMARPYETKIY